MALLGIRNEQEFYSDYYLEAIFKGDLKQVQARWTAQAEGWGLPAGGGKAAQ